MGKYATTTSISLLSPGYTISTAQLSLASLCITWAENEVNCALSRRYDVSSSPFDTSTTIPPLITSVTEQIALGHFFKANSRGGKESITFGSDFLKAGRTQLEMIRKYECDVTDSSGSLISKRVTNQIRTSTDYHTTFAQDNPLNWKVDEDKLDDIESDRG